MGTCATCGSPLSGQAKIYCSRVCSNRRAGVVRPPRTCPVCGKQFRNSGGVTRTCSSDCARDLRYQTTGKPWPSSPIYVQDCVICQRPFVTRRPAGDSCPPCSEYRRCPCGWIIRKPQRLCDTCREFRLREQRETQRRQARAGSRKQRRPVRSEPYALAEIAKRDGYRCGLCGKRVAMGLAVPYPDAPTIDHIVPISVSGDDTRANVQLAHFLCNSMAGAKGFANATCAVPAVPHGV